MVKEVYKVNPDRRLERITLEIDTCASNDPHDWDWKMILRQQLGSVYDAKAIAPDDSALRSIDQIANVTFEDAGEMANAVDQIAEIAERALGRNTSDA